MLIVCISACMQRPQTNEEKAADDRLLKIARSRGKDQVTNNIVFVIAK